MTRLVPAVIAAILLAVRAPVGAVTVAGAFVVSPLVAFGVVAAVVTVHLMGERTRHIAEDAEQRFLSDLAGIAVTHGHGPQHRHKARHESAASTGQARRDRTSRAHTSHENVFRWVRSSETSKT